MRKILALIGVAISILLLPVAVPAQKAEPRFGSAGQTVISSDLSFAGSYAEVETPTGTKTYTTTVTLSPALDYFAVDRLSVGLAYALQYNHTSLPGFADTLGNTIEPRLGYALPISDNLTFWPRVAIGLTFVNALTHGAPETDKVDVSAFAPILFHPAPHFFIGVGPLFFKDLTYVKGDGPKALIVGVGTQVGGFW
jgi:hypothetical protein